MSLFGAGRGEEVPVYLRAVGKIQNLCMSKRDLGRIVDEIWAYVHAQREVRRPYSLWRCCCCFVAIDVADTRCSCCVGRVEAAPASREREGGAETGGHHGSPDHRHEWLAGRRPWYSVCLCLQLTCSDWSVLCSLNVCRAVGGRGPDTGCRRVHWLWSSCPGGPGAADTHQDRRTRHSAVRGSLQSVLRGWLR
jgi:hypothetical protein